MAETIAVECCGPVMALDDTPDALDGYAEEVEEVDEDDAAPES